MDESSSEWADSDESPRDQSTILDDIAELADRKEGFDVCQVAAFWLGAGGCREISKWLLLKCWLAVVLQVFVTSFLIYEYYSTAEATLHLSHTKCKDDDVEVCYLTLVGLIGVFASIYMHRKFYSLANSGMYAVNMRTLENLPECISGATLLFGRIYNMFLYAGLCVANMYMLFKTHHLANLFLNTFERTNRLWRPQRRTLQVNLLAPPSFPLSLRIGCHHAQTPLSVRCLLQLWRKFLSH